MAALVVASVGLALAAWAFSIPEVSGPASTIQNGLIVFTNVYGSGEGEALFAIEPDGSGLTQLSPEGAAEYRQPTVSPDGSRVAVVHRIPSFNPGDAVIATLPIGGGSPTWLSDEPWYPFDPAWSPDGSRIAFAGSPGGPFGIYVMNADGTDPRLIPSTDEIDVGHPTWSPDGAHVAFQAGPGATGHPGLWDIYTAVLDGSGLTNLTNTPDVGETEPSWSWATGRIAFASSGPQGGILTMASDGTDIRRATEGADDAHPAWSPDGRFIVFDRPDADGKVNLFTITPDGTDLSQITTEGGYGAAWQPVPATRESPSPPSPEPAVSPPTGPIRPHLAGIIPVTDPQNAIVGEITAGGGGVWLGLWPQRSGVPDEIVRVDPVTNDVAATIPLDGTAGRMAVGAGSLWVRVGHDDGTFEVDRIDPASDQITARIPVAGDCSTGAIAASGDAVWASSGALDAGCSILRIDPATDSVVATVPIGIVPEGGEIVVEGDSVWFLDGESDGSGDLIRVDAQTNAVTDTIPIGGYGMTAGGGVLWVSVQPPGTERSEVSIAYLQRVDASSGRLIGDPIPVQGGRLDPIDGSSSAIAVGDDRVWLLGRSGEYAFTTVADLNAETFAVEDSVPMPIEASSGSAFDPVSDSIWIARVDSLIRVDLRDPEPTLTEPTAEQCPAQPEGGFDPVWSSTSAPAGSIVTISGNVPHYHEDGSYGPGDFLQSWWNVDPSDNGCDYLTPGATREPLAASPGPILLLGEANPRWACTYEIQVRVPDVAPGTYSIVGLESGYGGATSFPPIIFEVTGS